MEWGYRPNFNRGYLYNLTDASPISKDIFFASREKKSARVALRSAPMGKGYFDLM